MFNKWPTASFTYAFFSNSFAVMYYFCFFHSFFLSNPLTWLWVERSVPIKAPPPIYNFIKKAFSPRAQNPSGSPSVRWSSSTRCIRGPQLIKCFIYQLATYPRSCNAWFNHSHVQARSVTPRRGGALIAKKGCFQQSVILMSGQKPE